MKERKWGSVFESFSHIATISLALPMFKYNKKKKPQTSIRPQKCVNLPVRLSTNDSHLKSVKFSRQPNSLNKFLIKFTENVTHFRHCFFPILQTQKRVLVWSEHFFLKWSDAKYEMNSFQKLMFNYDESVQVVGKSSIFDMRVIKKALRSLLDYINQKYLTAKKPFFAIIKVRQGISKEYSAFWICT